MRKPSSFRNHPFSLVLAKNEAETVARNVMVILARTGDKFRPLLWDEYVLERGKDNMECSSEKKYFEQIIDYCKSSDTAELFSLSWKSKAGKK